MATKRELEDEAVRILLAHKRLPGDDKERRAMMIRDLAAVLVDLRERHLTAAGTPDWSGRTGAYKSTVRDIYSRAGYDADEKRVSLNTSRWHVGSIMRARVSPDELTAVGLSAAGPAARRRDRRARQTATLAADRAIGDGEPQPRTPKANLTDLREALKLLNRVRMRQPAPDAVYAAGQRALTAIVERANDLHRQAERVRAGGN